MGRGEFETVLYNWLAEANSPIGQFSSDVDRARWVTEHFTLWWQKKITADYRQVAGKCATVDHIVRERLGITRATEDGDELLDALEYLFPALDDLARSMDVDAPDTP